MNRNKLNIKLLSTFGQRGSAFSVALPQILQEIPNVMLLTADMSSTGALGRFKDANPDHFINVGIAEQNLLGMAAGLAEEGWRPICVAQACFITMRAFEQARQYAGYMHNPIVLVGIDSGYSTKFMGNTHYSLEDLSLMRLIPGMNVVAPCDALQAALALEAAVKSDTPTYIRLYGMPGHPIVYTSNEAPFEIGKANILKEGKDVKIVAIGSMVNVAMKAADQLKKMGIEAEVIDMHTLKPLDTSVLNKVSLVVTVEEHRMMGGLGEAVASHYMEAGIQTKLVRMSIPDSFGTVGNVPYMLEQSGLTVEGIVSTINNNFNKE